jgi:AcrR family transcriptional regulator
MSTTDDENDSMLVPAPAVRRRSHDAAGTRRALLHAAAELFQERGYDSATVREIGERAGVDPALIARYFESKQGLYLAALADEETGPPRAHVGSSDLVEVTRLLLSHWGERGMSPVMRALIGPAPGNEVRDQVRTILDAAIINPISEQLAARGLSYPRRRVELLLAMLTGAELLRRNGVLPALDDAPTEELLTLLEPLAQSLQQSGTSETER